MIVDLIKKLLNRLSVNELGLGDIVDLIGPVNSGAGTGSQIELHSAHNEIQSATLDLYPETGAPYLLTIKPAGDVLLTVSMLKPFLGEYHKARIDFDKRPIVFFNPQNMGTQWQVVVFVELEFEPAELDSVKVHSLFFRRDYLEKSLSGNV